MLRIDDTSKTLVAPQNNGFVAEAAPDRSELLTLVASGWSAFAGEIGQAHLRHLAVKPAPGVEMLAFDELGARLAIVQVSGESPRDQLGQALAAAGRIAAWDAGQLANVHDALRGAMVGESPRILLVAPSFDEDVVATADWLVRKHGLQIVAWSVQVVRFGSERLMSVVRAYPPRDPGAPSNAASEAQRLLGATAQANAAGTADAAPAGNSPLEAASGISAPPPLV